MRKFNLFLFFALMCSSSISATPSIAVDGKLPYAFSVYGTIAWNDTIKVYFSQGNLQYQASTNSWRFAEYQQHAIGGNGGTNNVVPYNVSSPNQTTSNRDTQTGWIDLFGWGTSGWDNTDTSLPNSDETSIHFQPWETCSTYHSTVNNNYQYGPSLTNVAAMHSWLESDATKNYDWGVYNSSDLGSGWRTLTKNEWYFLMLERKDASKLYGLAKVNINEVEYPGIILLPDNWDFSSETSTNIAVKWNACRGKEDFSNATFTENEWNLMETDGAVFLPAAGYRIGTDIYSAGSNGFYWSSTVDSDEGEIRALDIFFTKNTITTNNDRRYIGMSVRLVSDTPPLYPSSISVLPDAILSEFTFDGESHDLISAGTAEGGTMMFSVDNGDTWSDTIPKGKNVGTYTIKYMVDGDASHKDYTPSPNTITIEITKANIDVSELSVTGNSLYATGELQELVSVSGSVTGGTLKYKVNDGEWDTNIPTRSETGTYTVYYMVEGDENHNDYTPVPAYISVTIDEYPFVADNADPTSKLEDFSDDGAMTLKVKRTIYADGEYNTICLPFDISAEQLTANTHPLYGFDRLKVFKGAQVSGSGQDLHIDIFVEDTTAIKAGRPYLITYPSTNADIVDPVFTGITVTRTTPLNVSANGVTFQGMFAQVHIDPYTAEREEDYLFLGANSQLMWPSSDQTSGDIKMRGFRAYFIIDRAQIPAQAAPRGTRARIVDAPKTATDLENASATFGGSEKIIENGILYIIRNGVRYNAQGQIIK